MSNNNLTPMQSFEEKVKERLTKDIGDLIPDEALVAMIERATEDCFFKDKKKQSGHGYNSQTVYENSVFKTVVKELLAERMDNAIRGWIDANQELMAKELKTFIESSVEDAVMKGIVSMFQAPFEVMKLHMHREITDKFNKHGMY